MLSSLVAYAPDATASEFTFETESASDSQRASTSFNTFGRSFFESRTTTGGGAAGFGPFFSASVSYTDTETNGRASREQDRTTARMQAKVASLFRTLYRLEPRLLIELSENMITPSQRFESEMQGRSHVFKQEVSGRVFGHEEWVVGVLADTQSWQHPDSARPCGHLLHGSTGQGGRCVCSEAQRRQPAGPGYFANHRADPGGCAHRDGTDFSIPHTPRKGKRQQVALGFPNISPLKPQAASAAGGGGGGGGGNLNVMSGHLYLLHCRKCEGTNDEDRSGLG